MKLAWVQIIIALVIGTLLGSGLCMIKCKLCLGPCLQKGFYHKERILDKLSTKLNLSSDQKALVEAAINRKYERMKEVMKQTKEEIKTVLNPEQINKFDKLTAKCKGFN